MTWRVGSVAALTVENPWFCNPFTRFQIFFLLSVKNLPVFKFLSLFWSEQRRFDFLSEFFFSSHSFILIKSFLFCVWPLSPRNSLLVCPVNRKRVSIPQPWSEFPGKKKMAGPKLKMGEFDSHFFFGAKGVCHIFCRISLKFEIFGWSIYVFQGAREICDMSTCSKARRFPKY